MPALTRGLIEFGIMPENARLVEGEPALRFQVSGDARVPAHRIVELSPDTPACTGEARSCPPFGGHATSIYVLELPVGSIKKHNLAVSQIVNFQAP